MLQVQWLLKPQHWPQVFSWNLPAGLGVFRVCAVRRPLADDHVLAPFPWCSASKVPLSSMFSVHTSLGTALSLNTCGEGEGGVTFFPGTHPSLALHGTILDNTDNRVLWGLWIFLIQNPHIRFAPVFSTFYKQVKYALGF